MCVKSKSYGILLICALAAVLTLQPACTTPSEPGGEPAAESPASGAPATPGKRAAPGGPAGGTAAPAPQPPAAAQPQTVTVPEGTPLKVRTTTALSTQTHKTGDSFTASLEESLVEGGRVIAPKGSTVEGQIVEADPGGRVKGVARLAIRLTQLHLPGHQTVEITTDTHTRQARTTKKADATKVGIGAAIGAGIGAIAGGKKGAGIGAATGAGAGTGVVLATRGDPAVVPSESVLTFELQAPLTVTQR